MKPEDVYSEEYLRFDRRKSDIGVMVDPSNQFNFNQNLAAAAVFGRLTGGDTSPLDSIGLDLLSKSGRGDAISFRLKNDKAWTELRVALPSLPVEPAVWFSTQWLQNMVLDVQATMELLGAAGARFVDVRVTGPEGEPIDDAKIVAVYDVDRRVGVEVRTKADGMARLAVPSSWSELEAFTVLPRHSHWTFALRGWRPPTGPMVVQLRPLQTDQASPIYSYVDASSPQDGEGVRVAVIDAGVGPHKDLKILGGANFAELEDPAEAGSHADNGLGHGTHVAGIIGGRGVVDGRVKGLAPGVQLYSYRVCAKGMREGTDVAIASAIEEALEDGCDLINISMGYRMQSNLVSRRVRQALASGTAIIAAAGNGARSAVNFPAATPGVIAVSAIGRRGTVPQSTVSELALGLPTGSDPLDCLAAFTNVGVELWATAPGIGIVSCHPNDKYSAEDGTSMAAPVVTGLTARALSRNREVLEMKRDQARADEIRKLAVASARMLGFEPNAVGRGMPA